MSMNHTNARVSHTAQQGNRRTEFLGKAVEDKEYESRELKVQLDEQMPFMEGELKKIENEVSAGDAGSVKTTNYVIATYAGEDSNSAFPPDIRRGEQVIVWNYGDSDKYYWKSAGRDDKMRTFERVRYQVADQKETVKELNDENTYFIELDTLHEKRVLIQTSKSDGEKYKYMFKFDSKENTVRICDDDDNEIVIESDSPRVFMRNRDGSYVDVNRKNVIIFAPEDVVIKAGRQLIKDCPMETERAWNG